ncbi:hypothetical protein C8R43DRAFT_907239 [Mycena crocata]|nr:hypothetical protein C8R43DRAFT_907239 [Mycena crocata]
MVRGHLETLIEKNSQILPTVLDEERDAYAEESVRPNNREATSEGNFRFDVLGTPNSPWNKSAARVFSELTIRQLCLPNTVEMFNAIKHAFTAHMETIMRRYKRSGLSKSEKAHLKSMLRRYSRKYQVFAASPSWAKPRRFLAYMFKPLQKHIDMVEYLGVDGMSSDESEMEDVGGEHHVQYLIRSPRWRARCVSVWLRMFDSLHNILRRSGESFSHRGSFPRRRKPTQQQSLSTKFVAGLPINVYDEHWIERDPVRKYDLRPLTQHYNFSHDEDIMESVGSQLQSFF